MKRAGILRPWAVFVWLLVWQIGAMALDQQILLVSPIQVLARLGELALQAEFWKAVGFSMLRITGGFLLGAAVGTVLAAFSARLRLVEELQYALSNLDMGNFTADTQKRLETVEKTAQKADETANENSAAAKAGFEEVYEEIIRTAGELSSEFEVSLNQREDSILSQVSEEFTAKSDTAQLEETIRTELEQTSQKIEMRFSDAANLTQEVAGDLQEYQNLVETYIQFNTEGITLGKQGSPFQAVLGEERLSFLQNGVEIAYLSNNKLYITSGEILDRFTVGNDASGYFDWIPRGSGNLGMKWRKPAPPAALQPR